MSFDPALPDDEVNVSRTHPLREAAMLVGGLVGVVVLLALVTAFAVDLVVPRLPPHLEIKLFSRTWMPCGDQCEEPDPDAARLQQLGGNVMRLIVAGRARVNARARVARQLETR